MKITKISYLERADFTKDCITESVFIQDINTNHMKRVPLVDIFNWIKDVAKRDGLIVELKEDRILFIKPKQ